MIYELLGSWTYRSDICLENKESEEGLLADCIKPF